jgi:curved DNA-binding protein|tara:strand:- start:733 stop:1569 length:837 start_codon:yes stop_codon:yes gene_type:complete
MSNFYDILGVSRQATDSDLKKAYKKASMEHHPDRGGDAEQFKRINEAYSTLKDPSKRQQYDNPQPQGFNFNSQNFQDSNPFAGSPFDGMFGNGFQQQQRRQQRNQDMRIVAQIDLRDVVVGKQLVVQVKLGSGRVETINIDVPPGAKDNDTIQYEGLGDDRHPRMPRGNLHVIIQVSPVAGWERSNNDLITRKTVNIFDLLLGCVIIVQTLDKRSIRLTIPQGTNPGQRFSIPQYGIPDINTRRKGNVNVIIDVETPNIEDESLLNNIQQLRNEIYNG